MSIEASLSDSMRLIDENGNPHPMTKFQVRMMITIGWLAFLFAWLMNVLFYKVHPSFVDFSSKRFKEKCFVYIFGRKVILFKGEGKQISAKIVINLHLMIFKRVTIIFLDKQKDPENMKVQFARNLKTL